MPETEKGTVTLISDPATNLQLLPREGMIRSTIERRILSATLPQRMTQAFENATGGVSLGLHLPIRIWKTSSGQFLKTRARTVPTALL